MRDKQIKRCRVCTEALDGCSGRTGLCRHCERVLGAIVDWPHGNSESDWSALLREAQRLRAVAYGPQPDWETMDPDDERWRWHDKQYWHGEHGPCSAICITTGRVR